MTCACCSDWCVRTSMLSFPSPASSVMLSGWLAKLAALRKLAV